MSRVEKCFRQAESIALVLVAFVFFGVNGCVTRNGAHEDGVPEPRIGISGGPRVGLAGGAEMPVPMSPSVRTVRTFVESETKPVVVLFWKPDCPACQQFAPTFHALSQEFGRKASFIKVDVSRAGEWENEFGIRTIPTTVLYMRGQPAARAVGGKTLPELQKLFAAHL